MVKAVFHGVCPNCMGPVSSSRLEKGLPCSSCLKHDDVPQIKKAPREKRFSIIARSLTGNRLGAYTFLSNVFEELIDFEKLFKKNVGKRFWGLQRTWALRLLSGESFAITAPTGVGKTTLLLNYAVYQALRGKKVYILVPTDSLLVQTTNKLANIMERTKKQLNILVYNSRASKKKREENLEKIKNGDYDILITTTSFLSRRFELIQDKHFDIVLVDDADSLLKNSKNIDRILLLAGFSQEDIDNAYRLIKLKTELMIYRMNNNQEKIEKIMEEYEELELAVSTAKSTKKIGQLAIASATGRQSGTKPKLFRELLDFEIGGIHDYMRNIIETYYIGEKDEDLLEKLVGTIRKLGKGGLIFVSKDQGAETARRIVEYLGQKGINATLALAGRRVIDKLAKGEVDVLVGVSSYYGVIVRGIDLPLVVKYAIFYGVPKNRMSLEKSIINPRRLLQIMVYLIEQDPSLEEEFSSLQRRIERLTPGELMVIRIAFMKDLVETLTGKLGDIARDMEKAIGKVTKLLDENIPQKPGSYISIGTALIERGTDGKLYVITPDPMTYIQASGRTSRFLDDRMTLGFSLLLERNKTILDALEKRIRNYVLSFKPIPLSEVNLDEIKEALHKSRTTGEGSRKFKPAKSVLIIVESPNKARTIAQYFGRPSKRKFPGLNVYETPIIDPETLDTYLAMIVATKGHIFDLVIDNGVGLYGVIPVNNNYIPVFAPINRCLSCGHTFSSTTRKCPRCGETSRIKSSIDVIQALRKLALEAEEILIATDPDVEGEKIAWDAALAVTPYNSNIKRIEFHEVTREALVEAIRHPRKINKKRVAAQILRRITDRWIGFSLSQRLWKEYDKHWLGAGRVQTPVLGWIIDRYGMWKENQGYWIRTVGEGAPAIRFFIVDKKKAEETLDKLLEKKEVKIKEYKIQTYKANPPPPFTTDDLLYEAGRLFGYTAGFIMRIAQNLFEAGLITYHRTDSTRISTKGMGVAKEYFEKTLGKPELYYPRSWGTSGAHEAIRPTRPLSAKEIRKNIVDGTLRIPINLTEAHYKIYDLIFRRFMASQAKPSVLEKMLFTAEVNGLDAKVETIIAEKEEGYASILGVKMYPKMKEYAQQKKVPILPEKTMLYKGSLYTLYTQGDIIKQMRERDLGRPSTYAKIVESIKRHGYIILSKKRKYTIPTKIGMEVYNYLVTKYSPIVSEETTVELERKMRMVENGDLGHIELINQLYDLLENLELLSQDAQSLYKMTPESIIDEAII